MQCFKSKIIFHVSRKLINVTSFSHFLHINSCEITVAVCTWIIKRTFHWLCQVIFLLYQHQHFFFLNAGCKYSSLRFSLSFFSWNSINRKKYEKCILIFPFLPSWLLMKSFIHSFFFRSVPPFFFIHPQLFSIHFHIMRFTEGK